MSANLWHACANFLAGSGRRCQSCQGIELTDTIDTWAQNWNDNHQSLAWARPADDIIAKAERGRAGLTKTATDR